VDGLILVGRILFAIFFANAGIRHFTKREMMGGAMRSSGAFSGPLQPAADLAVVGTGVVLVVGALMVAAGIYADLGALLLAVFLVPTTPLMHGYWRETDPARRQQQQSAFLRNVALLGATLFLFGFLASRGHGMGLMVTNPLWTIH
jgi:putative oxidoreductase